MNDIYCNVILVMLPRLVEFMFIEFYIYHVFFINYRHFLCFFIKILSVIARAIAQLASYSFIAAVKKKLQLF